MRPPALAALLCGTLAAAGCGAATAKEERPLAGNAGEQVGDEAKGPGPSEDERRVAAIQHVVNDTEPARHLCWELAAAEVLDTEGQALLAVSFGVGGAVKDVAVIEETVDDARVIDCLVEVYKRYPWPTVFKNGEAIELPFAFAAPKAQYVVRRDLARRYDGTPGLAATIVIDAKNSGQSRASLVALEAEAGLEVALHRHPSTEVLVVEQGGGMVIDLDGKERSIKAGDAIYIAAGVAHGFRAGTEGATFLQVYAPAGAEQRFKDGLPSGTTAVGEDERNKPPKQFPRAVIAGSGERFELPAGSVEIVFDAGSTKDGGASHGRLSMPAGGAVPAHRHEQETEVLFLRGGGGTMTVGGVSLEVRAGHGVAIPPGVEHAFVAGSEGVDALQFYTPSGPEQRFKQAR